MAIMFLERKQYGYLPTDLATSTFSPYRKLSYWIISLIIFTFFTLPYWLGPFPILIPTDNQLSNL